MVIAASQQKMARRWGEVFKEFTRATFCEGHKKLYMAKLDNLFCILVIVDQPRGITVIQTKKQFHCYNEGPTPNRICIPSENLDYGPECIQMGTKNGLQKSQKSACPANI